MIQSLRSFDMSYRLYVTLRKQASLHCIVGVVSKTTMWIVLFFVSCTCLLVKGFGNEEMLGKGRWTVLNILKCEEPEQYEIQFEMTRKKINRTHDAYSIKADFNSGLNDTYGVEVVANKEVDGGFKFHSTITEESMCKNAKTYIGNTWQEILAKANIDPPECPIPVGEFIVDDYVIDYREFKEMGIYGKFDTYAYITYMGRRVACARWLMEFEKQREEDDDEDNDDY